MGYFFMCLGWDQTPRKPKVFRRLRLPSFTGKLEFSRPLSWFEPVRPNTKPLQRVVYLCLGAGSNRRPLALQANALPTELPKQN